MMGQTGKGLKFSFVLLCLFGLGGCSSTEDVPDPNASVSGFCGNWAKAACSNAVVLACSGAEKVDTGLTDKCVRKQQLFCEGLLLAPGYSSQKASQCLSAVQTAYNDARLTSAEIATVRHRGEPCNHLIKGPQAEGESCEVDDDCDTIKNYLCVKKSGVGSCRIPTVVANGTSCSAPDAACNTGFYCGVDESCVQSKAVGKACSEDFECQTGLVCTANKCSAKVSPDECTKDEDCPSNVCDIPVNSTSGMCVSAITLSASSGVCEDLR